MAWVNILTGKQVSYRLVSTIVPDSTGNYRALWCSLFCPLVLLPPEIPPHGTPLLVPCRAATIQPTEVEGDRCDDFRANESQGAGDPLEWWEPEGQLLWR